MQITGGKYNSLHIKTPDFDNIKPTLSKTRQGIFNSLLTMIEPENKVFFDLFSGSGIMSLEALSRGFRVISFEKDRKTAIAIKNCFKSLKLTPELYVGDTLKNIIKIDIKADVIFMDPPYDSELYEQSLSLIKEKQILKEDGIIIMEHPIEKIIKNDGFELIKAKTYGNKQISFLKYRTNQAE
ncbi:16S rRNA (guanine(966)-N(2))-methyltransferase RsmD [bacterium]|nr:16S rRNA (guanine(966)-N(2))-methyltransferase RsmD [bacterium]